MPSLIIDIDHSYLLEGRHGIYMIPKNDKFAGRSLLEYGEFSEGEYEIFEKLIEPHMIVAEVGANIGAHSVSLAKLSKQFSAFEPQPFCFKYLQTNILLNNLDNTKLYQIGLSNKKSIMYVPHPNNNIDNYGGCTLEAQGDIPVQVESGETYFGMGLDFLKADVEGMELQVLQGLRKVIRKYHPILYLENDRSNKSVDLVEYCWSLGYILYWHIPYLYNNNNYFNNPTNIFPNICSFNMIGVFNRTLDFGLPVITNPEHPFKDRM